MLFTLLHFLKVKSYPILHMLQLGMCAETSQNKRLQNVDVYETTEILIFLLFLQLKNCYITDSIQKLIM